MTKYVLEYYEKRARTPYRTVEATIPNGAKPTYTNSPECFDFKLSHCIRAKVRYHSNGALAAEKYIDKNGNGRLRWFKH